MHHSRYPLRANDCESRAKVTDVARPTIPWPLSCAASRRKIKYTNQSVDLMPRKGNASAPSSAAASWTSTSKKGPAAPGAAKATAASSGQPTSGFFHRPYGFVFAPNGVLAYLVLHYPARPKLFFFLVGGQQDSLELLILDILSHQGGDMERRDFPNS